MATLCTELGMPKYRENKKKWKRFLPGNIPANICRTQCLVRVWRCLSALQCAPPACMAARPLLDVQGCIFACASVYTIRKRARLCDSFWVLQACASTRGCFFMYIQSLLSSFPAHFPPSVLCGCARAQSVFYAYTHRFLIQRVPAGVSGFVCVHARPRALQQHVIMMSNGSCSHFTIQPFFLPLYAFCLSQRSPSYITRLNRPAKSVKYISLKCNSFITSP